MPNTLLPTSITIINVAIAVIYFQEQYLLGFRHQDQHQGNQYEFIGGKIEANETAPEALIREVEEEVGIDLSSNTLVKLGRLNHDYGDKQVCLQVYKAELTDFQFESYRHERYGLEGQALVWADKKDLLAGTYSLPDANKAILDWLQLPIQIVITYPLAHFNAQSNAEVAWLTYHEQHLPNQAWVYIRSKSTTSGESERQLIEQLLTLRPDIKSIVPHNNSHSSFSTDLVTASLQIQAYHLTQTELMHNVQQDYASDRPLLISCHDEVSIQAANRLAASRLVNQQAPVLGIFLSPVLVTQTHPGERPLGWQNWSVLAQFSDTPVIALGGLLPTMYQQATCHGASSIAGIRQFMSS